MIFLLMSLFIYLIPDFIFLSVYKKRKLERKREDKADIILNNIYQGINQPYSFQNKLYGLQFLPQNIYQSIITSSCLIFEYLSISFCHSLRITSVIFAAFPLAMSSCSRTSTGFK